MLRRLSLLVAVVASLLVFRAVPSSFAATSTAESACEGAAVAGVSVNCSDDAVDSPNGSNFAGLVRTVINTISIIVGAVSVIMIIVGGFRYIISNGDSNGVQGAKNTIIYAIIGLVVVLFAQIIVRFILTSVDSSGTPPPTP